VGTALSRTFSLSPAFGVVVAGGFSLAAMALMGDFSFSFFVEPAQGAFNP